MFEKGNYHWAENPIRTIFSLFERSISSSIPKTQRLPQYAHDLVSVIRISYSVVIVYFIPSSLLSILAGRRFSSTFTPLAARLHYARNNFARLFLCCVVGVDVDVAVVYFTGYLFIYSFCSVQTSMIIVHTMCVVNDCYIVFWLRCDRTKCGNKCDG